MPAARVTTGKSGSTAKGRRGAARLSATASASPGVRAGAGGAFVRGAAALRRAFASAGARRFGFAAVAGFLGLAGFFAAALRLVLDADRDFARAICPPTRR